MVDSYVRVILADIQAASDQFKDDAATFGAAIPKDLTGDTVNSGSAGLDQTVTAVLAAIDELHTKVTNRLVETSTNLKKTHDGYANTDNISASKISNDLMIGANSPMLPTPLGGWPTTGGAPWQVKP